MSQTVKKPWIYLLVTYFITWLCMGFESWQANLGYPAGPMAYRIVGSIGGYAPMLVALFLLRRELFHRAWLTQFLFGTAQPVGRYLLVGLLFLTSFGVYLLFGQTGGLTFGGFCGTLYVQTLFGGGMEEFGWRGYLFPAWERRYSPLIAALMVGAFWSLWHLPLWLVPGTYQIGTAFFPYLIHGIITTLSLVAVLKLTGSVLLCVLYHGWTNALYVSFPLNMSLPYWGVHLLEGVLAAGIYLTLYYRERRRPTQELESIQ